MRRGVVAVAILCLLALTGSAGAITPASGFVDTDAATGLTFVTSMVWEPNGDRLFVAEQGGKLRIVENGKLLPTPALSLTVDDDGERGLLGVELDPGFASNHYVYLYYTVRSPAHNRVSRFTLTGNTISPASEVQLLNLNTLSGATNHNGGAIHFGNDGKLYVAHGDNADGDNAQNMDNLLGKILRMNPDGSTPTDNPFANDVTVTGQNKLIWATGLRNPFTFAFRPGTGTMFIDDVGQSTWEEIDVGAAGANYGWPEVEGPEGTPNPLYDDPIYTYDHGDPQPNGCAITGGTFYDPSYVSFPAQYVGRYFFSDLCGDWIMQLDPGNGNAVTGFATGAAGPIDLDVGPDGALYYLEVNAGRVGRISYEDTPTVADPDPASGYPGSAVTLEGTYLAGATSVAFNGRPASFRVALDTRLVATIPDGATSGPISVTTGEGTVQTGTFTIVPVPPTITSFSPDHGVPGKKVNLKGVRFRGTTSVEINGTPAQTFTVKSDKKIEAIVAMGTTTGPISIDGANGPAVSTGVFTVPPPPSIATFTPMSGPVGTKIAITGTGFKGARTVTINGVKTGKSVQGDTAIIATVKKGTTSGQITVTGPSGSDTSAATFTVS